MAGLVEASLMGRLMAFRGFVFFSNGHGITVLLRHWKGFVGMVVGRCMDPGRLGYGRWSCCYSV